MLPSELRETVARLRVIAEAREIVTPSQLGIIADALSIAASEIERLGAQSSYEKTRYRHKKTGGLYVFECQAKDAETGAALVIYRNVSTRECWVRPLPEFTDGRFAEEGAAHV